MSRFKILISIAIGSAIGSLLSLEYLPTLFWWVGTLAGGLTGYISYEFKKVLEAVSKAWSKIRGFTVDIEGLKISFVTGIIMGTALSVMVIDFFLFMLILFLFTENHMVIQEVILTTFILVIVSFLSVSLGGFLSEFGYSKISRLRWRSEVSKKSKKVIIKGNLISLLWYIAKAILFVFIWIVQTALPTIWNFMKVLFKEIYSDLRLLCGVHAMLGSLVGFFAGSVIAGILVGCIAGLASYEIISKRIIGLAPK